LIREPLAKEPSPDARAGYSCHSTWERDKVATYPFLGRTNCRELADEKSDNGVKPNGWGEAVMRWFVALASFCLFLTGCAAAQQEHQPSRPFWFQRSDFTRPGNAETWQKQDQPLSICGESLGGLLKAMAQKP
jgi:hypothetical protein